MRVCDITQVLLLVLLCIITPSWCQSVFGCDEEWIRFENKCFRLHDIKVPFADAIDICAKDNFGQLATITSKREQDFIKKKVYVEQKYGSLPPFWIAGIRASLSNRDETFYWLGGEKFNYTDWFAGEPNNLGHEENCIAISSWGEHHASWYDNRCDDKIGVLCQRVLGIGVKQIDQEADASALLASQTETMSALSEKTWEENSSRLRVVRVLFFTSFCLIFVIGIFYVSGDFSKVYAGQS